MWIIDWMFSGASFLEIPVEDSNPIGGGHKYQNQYFEDRRGRLHDFETRHGLSCLLKYYIYIYTIVPVMEVVEIDY